MLRNRLDEKEKLTARRRFSLLGAAFHVGGLAKACTRRCSASQRLLVPKGLKQ